MADIIRPKPPTIIIDRGQSAGAGGSQEKDRQAGSRSGQGREKDQHGPFGQGVVFEQSFINRQGVHVRIKTGLFQGETHTQEPVLVREATVDEHGNVIEEALYGTKVSVSKSSFGVFLSSARTDQEVDRMTLATPDGTTLFELEARPAGVVQATITGPSQERKSQP